jgi:hypothetical protein
MTCDACHSDNQRTFDSEISIHSPGLAVADGSMTVRLEWTICMDCGRAVLGVPNAQLDLLVDSASKELQEVEGRWSL